MTQLDETNQGKGCPVDFEAVDYFFDQSLVPDPYPYYDYLRSQCPVRPATPHGVVAVTGHAEALAAYKDPAMSSCVAVAGPFPPLPFTPEGDDISALIETHRAEIPMAEHVVTMDGDLHSKTRGLLSKLITPKRLSENEEFMWRLADHQLDTFIDRGSCEFMEDYAKPFAMLVIADLLGVPLEDHAEFRRVLGNEVVGDINESDTVAHNPLQWLDDKFRDYITDRRREPREDVLTELAAATYPDGAVPEVEEVVKLATFLFAAGMETTTKLLSTGMRVLGGAAGHSAGASRRPCEDSRVPRGGVANGEPRQESLPIGEHHDEHWGSGCSGGHDPHDAAGSEQPRSAEVREPARVPARPPQRARARRLRPGCAFVSRRAAGALGGAHLLQSFP